MLTSVFIRSQIDALQDDDNENPDDMISDVSQETTSVSQDPSLTSFGNVTLGASEKPRSFREFELTRQQDPAFERFRLRLASFLDVLLRRDDSPVRINHNQPLVINPDDKVSNNVVIFLFDSIPKISHSSSNIAL